MTLVQNLALRRKVGKVSKDLNDKIFVTTIRCIELRYELESDGLKPWQWFFRAFPQCDAVAFLLRELGDREEDESTARAWNVLDLVSQLLRVQSPLPIDLQFWKRNFVDMIHLKEKMLTLSKTGLQRLGRFSDRLAPVQAYKRRDEPHCKSARQTRV